MSLLKHAYHIIFSKHPLFPEAWKNTPLKELEGWKKVAANNRVSTAAIVWSIWQVINNQFVERGRINFVYIEWMFRELKLIWPYGTLYIPTAELGRSRCGWSGLAITEENAVK